MISDLLISTHSLSLPAWPRLRISDSGEEYKSHRNTSYKEDYSSLLQISLLSHHILKQILIDGPVSSTQCPHLIILAVSPRDLVSCVVPQIRQRPVLDFLSGCNLCWYHVYITSWIYCLIRTLHTISDHDGDTALIMNLRVNQALIFIFICNNPHESLPLLASSCSGCGHPVLRTLSGIFC